MIKYLLRNKRDLDFFVILISISILLLNPVIILFNPC